MVRISLSSRWLSEAMIPKDMQVEITSVGVTFIMLDTSRSVTYSVSFRTFSPS